MKKPKYGNKKVIIDGIVFDSKKESRRYFELKMLLNAGEIYDLELQKTFKFEINGEPLKTNQKGSRQLSYIADFCYTTTKGNNKIVEDVKSAATKNIPVFKYKQALLWTIYKIEIVVV